MTRTLVIIMCVIVFMHTHVHTMLRAQKKEDIIMHNLLQSACTCEKQATKEFSKEMSIYNEQNLKITFHTINVNMKTEINFNISSISSFRNSHTKHSHPFLVTWWCTAQQTGGTGAMRLYQQYRLYWGICINYSFIHKSKLQKKITSIM